MRVRAGFCLSLLALAGGLAGCAVRDEPLANCPVREYTFHFAPGHRLENAPPAQAGAEPGNGFTEGFANNDLKEWLSRPISSGLLLQGNVTLEFWARSSGTVAPIVDQGNPSTGYHFFNQFGSNRSFQPAYAIEYNDAVAPLGTVYYYLEQFDLPKGGFVVESGDRLRLLLTDLTANDADGSGMDILYGGTTPSQLSFHATCYEPTAGSWSCEEHAVALRGNQGLLTGAAPPMEGFNFVAFNFSLSPSSHRIQVDLHQTSADTGAKQDIDLDIQDVGGRSIWPVGSPYTNEHGEIYEGNVEALFAAGPYKVVVNSYSGSNYEGVLRICTLEATS